MLNATSYNSIKPVISMYIVHVELVIFCHKQTVKRLITNPKYKFLLIVHNVSVIYRKVAFYYSLIWTRALIIYTDGINNVHSIPFRSVPSLSVQLRVFPFRSEPFPLASEPSCSVPSCSVSFRIFLFTSEPFGSLPSPSIPFGSESFHSSLSLSVRCRALTVGS